MTNPDLNKLNGNFISAGVLSSSWQAGEVVDLNDVFRNVLHKYSLTGGIIFRCDKMPLVEGSPENYSCLFDALLSMIVSHPPVGSKLFLYIKCFPEMVDSDVMDLLVKGDYSRYKIEIYSNITTDKNWEMLYQAKLAECKSQSAKVSANFLFSPIANTGCLFSLTLPGKIN